MKKILFFFLVSFIILPCIHAREPLLIPEREFEIGINTNAFLANNLLTFPDVFNSEGTIFFDFGKVNNNFLFTAGAGFTPLFFNIYNKRDWGFGFSIDVEAMGALNLSGDFLLLNEAVKEKSSVGGAIFIAATVNTFFLINKFRVTFSPAMYYTLAYLTSDVYYTQETIPGYGTEVFMDYIIHIHSMFPLNKITNAFPAAFNGIPGFDFSIGVEYPLSKEIGIGDRFPILDFDVGLNFINIPVPYLTSLTRDYMRITGSLGNKGNRFLIDGDINIDDLFDKGEIYYAETGENNWKIIRPFKMNIYADWLPLERSRLLTLRPVLGFSISQLHPKPFFMEGGFNAFFNYNNFFFLSAGINYLDRMWINSLDFSFNFGGMQFDIGTDIRSQSFLNSWIVSGYGIRTGIRFGK